MSIKNLESPNFAMSLDSEYFLPKNTNIIELNLKNQSTALDPIEIEWKNDDDAIIIEEDFSRWRKGFLVVLPTLPATQIVSTAGSTITIITEWDGLDQGPNYEPMFQLLGVNGVNEGAGGDPVIDVLLWSVKSKPDDAALVTINMFNNTLGDQFFTKIVFNYAWF